MIPDPIVEEVRAIREEIAKECGYDIDVIFQRLLQLETTSPVPHVSLTPRRVPDEDPDDSLRVRGAA
jgi:hypothetical protein